MPIYEYYCPQNHTIYQFFAKTLAQGRKVPKCPDNPGYTMRKLVSTFAVTEGGRKEGTFPEREVGPAGASGGDPAEDSRMEAAMGEMEREFANVDENDPRAMGRMMRRMAELTGEKIDGEMEEVVRKLEEGADPDSLEEQFGGEESGDGDPYGEGPATPEGAEAGKREARHRFKSRKLPPRKDPKLYDYE